MHDVGSETAASDVRSVKVLLPPIVSIIVPTFNERGNVGELVKRIASCMHDVSWEVIFVDDDSPDGTADAVRAIGGFDARVRVVQRVKRRGLASACVEGMLASTVPFVAVMDADLQHDESLLPEMLKVLRTEPIDIAVGSRYVAGGSVGGWDRTRSWISQLATMLSRRVMRTDISDPMSGFFMLRTELLRACVHRISAIGFKILFDLIASCPQPPRIRELPFTFRNRYSGESKLDARWHGTISCSCSISCLGMYCQFASSCSRLSALSAWASIFSHLRCCSGH
jgi:dolichol-phosphate mannosyltransferase